MTKGDSHAIIIIAAAPRQNDWQNLRERCLRKRCMLASINCWRSRDALNHFSRTRTISFLDNSSADSSSTMTRPAWLDF